MKSKFLSTYRSSVILFGIYLCFCTLQSLSFLRTSSFLWLKLILDLAALILIYHFINRVRFRFICLIMVVFYFTWALYSLVPPISDFRKFFIDAAKFSKTFSMIELIETKSFPTILYYSIFFKILGIHEMTIYVASITAWIVSSWIFYRVLLDSEFDARQAKFTAGIFGLSPSVIFYSPIMSSESVFILLVLLQLFLVIEIKKQNHIIYFAAFGVVSGLTFLTRGNGLFFIVPMWMAVFYNLYRKKLFRLVPAFAVVGSFFLPLSFEGYMNLKFNDRYGFSNSKSFAYNLLIGTNEKTKGQYNSEDLELVHYDGNPSQQSRNLAMKIAKTRILENPVHFFQFALTDKIQSLWGRGDWGLTWSVDHIYENPMRYHKKLLNFFRNISNQYSLLLLVGSAFFLFQFAFSGIGESGGRSEMIVLIIFPLLLLSALHVFIEVQTRYQIPFLPFLSIFFTSFIAWLHRMIIDIKSRNEKST